MILRAEDISLRRPCWRYRDLVRSSMIDELDTTKKGEFVCCVPSYFDWLPS